MPFSYLMKFLCLQTSPIFMKKVPKSLFASTFKGFKMKIPLAINFSEPEAFVPCLTYVFVNI